MYKSALPLALLMALAGCNPATSTAERAGGAETKAPSKPVLLRLSQKAGEKYEYASVTDSSAKIVDKEAGKDWPKEYQDPATFYVEGKFYVKVDKVENGKTTFTMSTENLTAKGTGFGERDAKEVTKTKHKPITFVVNDRWEKLDQQVIVNPLIDSLNRMFPEKAVSVGDKWEYEAFESAPKAKATFEKEETVGGYECAKVAVEMPPVNEGDTTNLTAWVDMKTGRFIQLWLDMTSLNKGLSIATKFRQTIVTK